MSKFIPCQKCGHQYVEDWTWYVCDTCGYRICMNCFGSHSGPGNGYNMGGSKCSQCQTGWLHLQHGIRSNVEESRPASKLDEYLLRARGQKQTPPSPEEKASVEDQMHHDEFTLNRSSNKVADGIILTNTRLIANKYNNTSSQDVLRLIQEFTDRSFDIQGFQWELIDLGAKDMDGAIDKDASWMDYAQLLADYSDGVGIKKSANTPLFIIGGSDVIPMPDFFASIGHDIKTIEDSDFLYCFPIDYPWKRISVKDAIFNVSRLPLDYVGKGTLDSTIEKDLGAYFQRALDSLEFGIPFTYAMMTSNSGKTDRNDWTWTSADVMAKLPQQQLENDGVLTKDNMFLCPTLDVLGEEYLSNENVEQYQHYLEKNGYALH